MLGQREIEGKTQKWLETKSMAKVCHLMNEINEKFLPKREKEFTSGGEGNVKSVLENHSIGGEVPAGEMVRIEEIFGEDSQLEVVERLAISSHQKLGIEV